LLLSIATIAGLVYLLFGLYLYANQDRMLYYPEFAQARNDLPTERFEIDGETIRVHVLNPGRPAAALYFGGNGESVGYSAGALASALPDRTLYLVNYRGYGGSTGKPQEAALYSDAAFIFDAVAGQHAEFAVIGRSLGSGVATWLAAERDIARLVLITPFDSIAGIAKRHFPLYPVTLFMKERYVSADRVGRIDAPTLLLIASDDTIVPMASSRRLEKVFPPEQVSTFVLEGTGHNSISNHPDYYRRIADFLSIDDRR
jgi:pimeloyl-ACP methyl ester carboxylesterase